MDDIDLKILRNLQDSPGISMVELALANPAFAALAEMTPEQVLGKSALELGIWRDVSEPERLRDALAAEGWVRNLPDRTVETLAVGSREQLESYQRWLQHGPPEAPEVVAHDEHRRQPAGLPAA